MAMAPAGADSAVGGSTGRAVDHLAEGMAKVETVAVEALGQSSAHNLPPCGAATLSLVPHGRARESALVLRDQTSSTAADVQGRCRD